MAQQFTFHLRNGPAGTPGQAVLFCRPSTMHVQQLCIPWYLSGLISVGFAKMAVIRPGVICAVVFCALAFPLSAFAGLQPDTPICSLRVNPTSGGSPLTVDTTNSDCFEFDRNGQPVPLTMTISWGDKT